MLKYAAVALVLAAASVALLPFTLFREGADESDESLLLVLGAIAAIFFVPPFVASAFVDAGRVAVDAGLGIVTALLLVMIGIEAPWFVAAPFCLLAVLGGLAGRAVARRAV